MKRSLKFAVTLLLGSTAAVSAMAQTAPAPAPTPAPAPAQTAPATFSDAELLGFANAAINADKIQKDATIAEADKQTKMLAAVEAQGLNPTRYNEIAQATRSNPDLVKKIQELASANMATTTKNP